MVQPPGSGCNGHSLPPKRPQPSPKRPPAPRQPQMLSPKYDAVSSSASGPAAERADRSAPQCVAGGEAAAMGTGATSTDGRSRNRDVSKAVRGCGVASPTAGTAAASASSPPPSPQLEYVCSLSAFLHYVQASCCTTALALAFSYPRWLTAAGGAWVVLTSICAIVFSAYSFVSKMPILYGRCMPSRQPLVDLVGYASCTLAFVISVAVCGNAVTHRYFLETLEDGRSVVSGVMHIEACIFFVSAALLAYGLRTLVALRQWRASRGAL